MISSLGRNISCRGKCISKKFKVPAYRLTDSNPIFYPVFAKKIIETKIEEEFPFRFSSLSAGRSPVGSTTKHLNILSMGAQ
jgi:hypothetical protein